MPLVSVSVENYRCFATKQTLELRPITLVLGKNNSGKSALARSPLVLSKGILTDSPMPLDLDQLSNELGTPSFTDLVYGMRPHGNIRVGLRFSGESLPPLKIEAVIQNIDEWQLQVVSSLKLQTSDRTITLEWLPGTDPRPDERIYRINSGQESDTSTAVRFEGLLPTQFADDSESVQSIYRIIERVRSEFSNIRYLGPFRERPSRLYRLPSRIPREVGTNGDAAAGILANDMARGQGDLISRVNEFLGKNLPGWSIEVVERGGMYSVIFRSTADSTITVNVSDVGTGVAQALPIFVQRAMDALRPPIEDVLEIIEEPELHLHPSAHALLADLYLAAAREPGVRFLIETHSETLLLRLRRRVAEGLSPDNIAIYYVENNGGSATARRINIDSMGNLDYWPQGVFSEDFDETRALVSAQLERTDPDES
ncbi:DUF3696 domain-containing protein [Streptomyces fulvissimus]|uniref:DUF3696 domain-containing protein n=1 Tax=Streptomyces microflavus TaxID=1919 RepID=A0A6N9VIW7_STRMI|nr:DUF3696 domain-containing protein [Streptomyces microflavus]NEB70011.1 DUF3696 domain-containing protein [Streptomyces microflavus]